MDQYNVREDIRFCDQALGEDAVRGYTLVKGALGVVMLLIALLLCV